MKLKILVIAAALLTLCTTPAAATETDYMGEMIAAVEINADDWGQAAEAARNQKIIDQGLELVAVAYADLELLAKVIQSEAGSSWLSLDWKMCVGEVALNRVASPEFPDALDEVVHQPGQYYGANSGHIDRMVPSHDCIVAAARVLQGERLMVPSVVFQSNSPQGGGVYKKMHDRIFGNTYFCYSSRPGLYE